MKRASVSCWIWGVCPSMMLRDRKSTRLNSSHQIISYAVFCLKKKMRFAVASVITGDPVLLVEHMVAFDAALVNGPHVGAVSDDENVSDLARRARDRSMRIRRE